MSETRTEKRVMAEAMRSTPECAASESMPSEPVRIPVSSLSSVMAKAASTEESAAVLLAAEVCCISSGVAPGLMELMVLGAVDSCRLRLVAQVQHDGGSEQH